MVCRAGLLDTVRWSAAVLCAVAEAIVQCAVLRRRIDGGVSEADLDRETRRRSMLQQAAENLDQIVADRSQWRDASATATILLQP
jgi:hypothetical protein